MPACHEDYGKPYFAQIAFGFIWKVSIHSGSLEMPSDGEVLIRGYAVKCDELDPK